VSFKNDEILYRVNDDDPNKNGYESTFHNKGHQIDIPEDVLDYMNWDATDILLRTLNDETISIEIYEWKPGEDE
jgi:hypothetical protein